MGGDALLAPGEAHALGPVVPLTLTLSIAAMSPAMAGSSPRVRGTESAQPCPPPSCRFIPACAGNSCSGFFASRPFPVHPRVCGEQLSFAYSLAGRYGSSPRVRGTGDEGVRRYDSPRFIPACAGNRSPCPGSCGCTPVHPRVCGEQFPSRRALLNSGGSSPRVRGTDLRCDLAARRTRFIPACAGNRIVVAIH